MKKLLLCLFAVLTSAPSWAAEPSCAQRMGQPATPCITVERAGAFQGVLYAGGGTDATTVTVLTDQGERIRAYCNELCSKLFGPADENEVVALRKPVVGKRVAMDVRIERNAGRIPGPDDNDKIPLVKRITLLD